MSARMLVMGLDGLDLDVVRSMGRAATPALHDVMKTGAFAHLRSVQPPATLPNWTTFLTGADPGAHGVFDFTIRDGYNVRFAAGTAREVPTLFSRLDALGLRCACLSFPATWPPEELEHGVFMSGWDAPVAFEADKSFVWPPSLYDEIKQRFGTLQFDDVNEFKADIPGWIDRLPAALCARIERKLALCEWLLDREQWDVFAVYFGESDTASHYLWSMHDRLSPRRPASVSAQAENGLTRVYGALDTAVSRLRVAAGETNTFLTLSDHGSGGASDRVLYLNKVLESAGLLRFRPEQSRLSELARALKTLALTHLPPRLKEWLFRVGGAKLPGLLESHVRFGNIDMEHTVAFSDELNYFPAVHLNLRGREPNGVVAQDDVEEVVARVRSALLRLRDPWTGRAAVRNVVRREDLFQGDYVSRAPDLIVELSLADGYSYNLMPSAQAPDSTPWRRLAEEEKLGKKGRSLPGSHRPRGFFAMTGERVNAVGELDVAIQDVPATLLELLGTAVPPLFSGRVLWEALAETGDETRTLPDASVVRSPSERGETHVEKRLRALGYIQ